MAGAGRQAGTVGGSGADNSRGGGGGGGSQGDRAAGGQGGSQDSEGGSSLANQGLQVRCGVACLAASHSTDGCLCCSLEASGCPIGRQARQRSRPAICNLPRQMYHCVGAVAVAIPAIEGQLQAHMCFDPASSPHRVPGSITERVKIFRDLPRSSLSQGSLGIGSLKECTAS